MPREVTRKRDLMRDQLAYHAAKLMAENGINDHAYAKRKAAKQLGATDTQHLPSNEEIDAALRSFRSLFQSDSHPQILHELRHIALQQMTQLAEFHPYLTGSTLSGLAGELSDINIMVFSDDEKAVLLFLLKNNIDFTDGEWRIRLNGYEQLVPSYTIADKSGTSTHVIVLPENARYSGSRHPDTHADIASLTSLLTSTTPQSA